MNKVSLELLIKLKLICLKRIYLINNLFILAIKRVYFHGNFNSDAVLMTFSLNLVI